MWKRMREPWLITVALATLVLSWAVSWTLVFKAGWRFMDFVSEGDMDANSSFMAYLVTFGMLSPVVLLLLAIVVIVLTDIKRMEFCSSKGNRMMKSFNYHAWATRNSSGNKHVFTAKEHALYFVTSVIALAGCFAAMTWAVKFFSQLFSG